MSMRTDRTTDLADADAVAGLGKAFFRAPEFVEHERQFQTKRDRLGVNAVAAPDHRRHFESARLFGDCRS